jgi:topoisomerase-4 subunit B
MADAANGYDGSSIKTLSPLMHIRHRPGMYIGRLGDGTHPEDGIYVLVKEIIDNCIDEFTGVGSGSTSRLTRAATASATTARHSARQARPPASGDEHRRQIRGRRLRLFERTQRRRDQGGQRASERFTVARFARQIPRGPLRTRRAPERGEAKPPTATAPSSPSPDPELFPAMRPSGIPDKRSGLRLLNRGFHLPQQPLIFARGLEICSKPKPRGQDYRSSPIKARPSNSPHPQRQLRRNLLQLRQRHYTTTAHPPLRVQGRVLRRINEILRQSFKADDVRDGMMGAIASNWRPIFESRPRTCRQHDCAARGASVATLVDSSQKPRSRRNRLNKVSRTNRAPPDPGDEEKSQAAGSKANCVSQVKD